MGEEMPQFRTEGQPAFPAETGDETPAASTAEDKQGTDTPPPDGGKNTQADPDKDVPFHKHPAWMRREDEWKQRFNDQEARFQEDLRKMREEFGGSKKEKTAERSSDIPPWFGGDQAQWDQFEAHMTSKMSAAEEAAYKRLKSESEAEDKATKEATDWFRSEVAAIEADKDLNPDGAKIDPNALLKVALDNDLIDSKQRWNYRAAFRLMKASEHTKQSHAGARKELAKATTSDPKSDPKSATFKTSEDFKKSRPW